MMQRLLAAASVAATVALVGCGDDYYYLERLEIEGDTLVATFAFTCPGVRLAWDGSFPQPQHADLSVQTAGDGCDGPSNASFDLRPMKRAYLATQKDPIGFLDIRVPDYQDSRKPQCATYYFSVRDVEEPGRGFASECY